MKKQFKTLDKLLKENEGSSLSYSELLLTKEWRDFRNIILKRDNFQCQKCKALGNEKAWWIKDSKPTNLYARPYSEEEQKLLGEEIELSSIHIQLNVHHKYYINNNYPWQYKKKALIAVCEECHEKIHQKKEIPVYQNSDKIKKIPTHKCSKCNGTGYLKEFDYYLRGICFKCDGKGYKEIKSV